jgi:Tol biopolymer transport system component
MPVANSPFILLPTGTGEHREITPSGISPEQAAAWFPDSQRFVFAGGEKGHRPRLYVQGLDGGAARPIGPDGVTSALPGFAISPDGTLVAAIGPEHKAILVPVDGGPTRALAGVEEGEFPLRFSPDGRSVYLWKRGDVPARVTRLDLGTGRRETWKDLLPADPAGVERISNVLVTPDGKGYAYCYARLLSDLFVVAGLR